MIFSLKDDYEVAFLLKTAVMKWMQVRANRRSRLAPVAAVCHLLRNRDAALVYGTDLRVLGLKTSQRNMVTDARRSYRCSQTFDMSRLAAHRGANRTALFTIAARAFVNTSITELLPRRLRGTAEMFMLRPLLLAKSRSPRKAMRRADKERADDERDERIQVGQAAQ